MSDNDGVTFDYIVVGGGLAGCIVASRLSEDPRVCVALLEAGGENDHEASYFATGVHDLWTMETNWHFQTAPQAALGGRRVNHPRGRLIGGSAAINVGSWSRGIAEDYSRWEEAGAAGWGWPTALDAFLSIETSQRPAEGGRGRRGPMILEDTPVVSDMTEAIRLACREAGIGQTDDHNGTHFEGFDRWETIFPHGRRRNSAEAYLAQARNRPNLRVVTDAFVTFITFAGRRATGVVYERDGVRHTMSACREVVLCAGAFHSPAILMASGIGPAEHLRELAIPVVVDSLGVGSHLIDHLATRVGWRASGPGGIAPVYPDKTNPEELEQWRRTGYGPLAANPNPCIAFIRSRDTVAHADIELLFHVNPPEALRVDDRTGGFDVLIAHVDPASRGTVRLASNDPRDLPVVDPAYLSDPGDIVALTHGVRRALAVARTSALAPYTDVGQLALDASDEQIQAWIREHPVSMFHPVGTARMGREDDPLAVLDDHLRVKGVEGLRVVDASAMPGTVRGHTMAPVVYIAERACMLIRNERRSGH